MCRILVGSMLEGRELEPLLGGRPQRSRHDRAAVGAVPRARRVLTPSLRSMSASKGNVLRAAAGRTAARCGVLSRVHTFRYGRSLRPCIACCATAAARQHHLWRH
jgi:hypothetical protein